MSSLAAWLLQACPRAGFPGGDGRLGGVAWLSWAGPLEPRRGRGTTVAGRAPERSVVLTKARELAQVARREGSRRAELARLTESTR